MAGDADVGHQSVAVAAEVFDDRDQADVEIAGRESVGESARQVEDQLRGRGELGETMNERPGVEVADRSDANRLHARLLRHRENLTTGRAGFHAERPTGTNGATAIRGGR